MQTIWNHCIVFILALCFIPMWSFTITRPDKDKGPCYCAIFDTNKAKEEAKPLIKKNYMSVVCDRNGTALCTELCTSLAKASKERATQALCQNLEHVENLIASLYTKTCDNEWQYAGITAEDPICCHDKKITECKKVATTPKP